MASGGDFFAQQAERERKLHEQFAAAPAVEVVGVVDAGGAGGANSPR